MFLFFLGEIPPVHRTAFAELCRIFGFGSANTAAREGNKFFLNQINSNQVYLSCISVTAAVSGGNLEYALETHGKLQIDVCARFKKRSVVLITFVENIKYFCSYVVLFFTAEIKAHAEVGGGESAKVIVGRT